MQFLNDAKKAQDAIDFAVRTGDIKLADNLIKLKLGIPDLDIAVKANQFAMLRHLNNSRLEGKCECKATQRLADHAARTGDTDMVDYISIWCKKYFDGTSLMMAAVESGELEMVKLVYSYERREIIRWASVYDYEELREEAASNDSFDIMEYLEDPQKFRPIECVVS